MRYLTHKNGWSWRSHTASLMGATMLSFVGASPALAQVMAGSSQSSSQQSESSPQTEDAQQSQDIIVTASRAAPTGFQAPTPTTTISSGAILTQGASNIGQVLLTNPAFKASQNPLSNAVKAQNPSQATADLRGLGAQRTLVLVDGMRMVPSAASNTGSTGMAPDINRIPVLMIDRLEVVTGGASSQWGSDAVAGVVNFILKKKYEGLMAKADMGISQEGDFRSTSLSALAGTSFADGRGSVVVAGDYFQNTGLGDIYTRDWGRKEYSTFTNSAFATNGRPALIVTPNVRAALSPGGLITGPAGFSLRNYEFLPNGTTRPFQFGSLVSGTTMIGGQGASLAKGVDGAPAVDRFSSMLYGEYEFSSELTGFIELSYAEAKGAFDNLPGRFTTTTIKRDNAYLPAAVGAAMDSAGISSFTLARINYDLGPAIVAVRTRTPQGAVGLRGKIGDWNWDAHYSYGHNYYSQTVSNDPVSARYAFAADAVQQNGTIVCRATIPGASFNAAAAGCVPVNLFGAGSPSSQAAAYIQQTAFSKALYDQHSAGLNIQGKPFETWAGPVGVGAGVEYRKETIKVTANPLTQAGAFATTGNATAFSGGFSVKEAYLDTNVPLARDLAFARALDMSAAIRVADYSNVGTQTTWKVGGVYEPVRGLRLRTTRSRDIRAPALNELFAQGANVPQIISVRGYSVLIPTNVSKGDPNVGPERADTFTAGVVFEPAGIPNLQASVDYFNINVKGAITNIMGGAASLCNGGSAYACSLFTFDPVTGAPTSLTTTSVNAATLHYIGYDAALRYRLPASSIASSMGGDFEFTLNGTYMEHAYINLGAGGGTIDRAGENGGVNNGAIARFTSEFSAGYSNNGSSLTARIRYISKGKIDNSFNTTPSNTINDNRVPSVVYVNLYGTLAIGQDQKQSLFFAVDNLFDKDPPVVPYPTVLSTTNVQYYDKVGRAFRVGVTLKL